MSPTNEELNALIGENDTRVWTKRWLEVVAENPSIPTDEGTMLGWFSNVFMAGFDQSQKQERSKETTWVLIERYCENFAEDEYRLVFRKENQFNEITVGKEVYDSFNSTLRQVGELDASE